VAFKKRLIPMKHKLLIIFSIILLWLILAADTCEQSQSKLYHSANRDYIFNIDGMHYGRCLGTLSKSTFFGYTLLWKKYLTQREGQPLLSLISNSGSQVILFYDSYREYLSIDIFAEYVDTGVFVGHYSLKSFLDSTQMRHTPVNDIEAAMCPQSWFDVGDSVVNVKLVSKDSQNNDTLRFHIPKIIITKPI
jgi:hypothetical protein